MPWLIAQATLSLAPPWNWIGLGVAVLVNVVLLAAVVTLVSKIGMRPSHKPAELPESPRYKALTAPEAPKALPAPEDT